MQRIHVVQLTAIIMLLAACATPTPAAAPSAQAPTSVPVVATVTTAPATVAAPPSDTPAPTASPVPTATIAPTVTPTFTSTTAPATSTATPTPLPTETPEPSPTPKQLALVTGDINLRGGPGVGYPVVGQAKKGASLSVVARTLDSAWLVVRVGELEGWVSTKLVALNLPVETLPVVKSVPPTPTPKPTRPPQPAAAPQAKPGGATGTIVGRVLGPGGEPRAGEHVVLIITNIHQSVPQMEAYSGPDGRFALNNVPAGKDNMLMLIVGAPGHAVMVDVNGKRVFTIEPGQVLDVVNVNLP